MKFEIGDKVQTEFGVGKVLFIDDDCVVPYLVGIKGFDGDSGYSFLTEKEVQRCVIDKGYGGQCRWFYEYELELIKEDK